MWLQPPLLREHWSAGTGRARHLLVPLPGHPAAPRPAPRPAPRSPQSSPSSEPSPQSSEPSQSFSGGRQMEVLLAQVCEGGLHTRDSQFSSSELSSQSLSPSQTQALLMHRADGEGAQQKQKGCYSRHFQMLSQARGVWGCLSSSGLPKNWTRAGPGRTGQGGPGQGTGGHWGLRGAAPELMSLHPHPKPTKVCPSPFLREGEKGSEDDTIHQDHGSWVGRLCFPTTPAPRRAQHPQVGSPFPCPHPSPCSRI